MQPPQFIALTLLAIFAPTIAKSEHILQKPNGEIVLPLHLNKDGYPLIDGSVNGTAGIFLLDTGDSDRFLLNRNYVPMDAGVQAGGATSASGQSLTIRRHAGSYRATLSGVLSVFASAGDRHDPESTLSVDARQQQEDIDPHLLGWLGWGFLKEYVTTVDYRNNLLRLVPLKSAPRVARPHKSIVISFTPSSPVLPFTVVVGGHLTPAILDTAGWDRLALQPSSWAKVMAATAVQSRPGKNCITIKAASIGARVIEVVDIERAERSAERLTLGIGFLRRFTGTWDPRDGTVTLVPNGITAPPLDDCS